MVRASYMAGERPPLQQWCSEHRITGYTAHQTVATPSPSVYKRGLSPSKPRYSLLLHNMTRYLGRASAHALLAVIVFKGVQSAPGPNLDRREGTNTSAYSGPFVKCTRTVSDVIASSSTLKVANCSDLLQALHDNGVDMSYIEFYAANPEIGPNCTQSLKDLDMPPGNFCVNTADHISDANYVPARTPPNTTLNDNCSLYHTVALNEQCYQLCQRYGFNEDQFHAMNPSVRFRFCTPEC
ncbi:hypothetical protein DFH06DRAFT_180295 [Mycena polygramma]|nr:hypothetical protein DFH06DRAFT_180295 [Mycena polygramma]